MKVFLIIIIIYFPLYLNGKKGDPQNATTSQLQKSDNSRKENPSEQKKQHSKQPQGQSEGISVLCN